jgi:hypothetical protein
MALGGGVKIILSIESSHDPKTPPEAKCRTLIRWNDEKHWGSRLPLDDATLRGGDPNVAEDQKEGYPASNTEIG